MGDAIHDTAIQSSYVMYSHPLPPPRSPRGPRTRERCRMCLATADCANYLMPACCCPVHSLVERRLSKGGTWLRANPCHLSLSPFGAQKCHLPHQDASTLKKSRREPPQSPHVPGKSDNLPCRRRSEQRTHHKHTCDRKAPGYAWRCRPGRPHIPGQAPLSR